MLEGLKRQGIIEVVKEDPLQIKILTARKAEHEYEELFLQSFDTQGAGPLRAARRLLREGAGEAPGEDLGLRHRRDEGIL